MTLRLVVLSCALASVLVVSGCRACDGGGSATTTSASGSAAPTIAALPEVTAADRAGAEDAVVAYYAAVSVKDCAGMNKHAAKPHTAQECDKIIEDYTEHGTKFVRIDDVKRDGRDPNAVLVKVILLFKDKDHPTLVSATKIGNEWRVRN
jgi:hypothetical protein